MKNQLIKFHETELIAVTDESGTHYVAIKPICDAIGLNVDSALRAIKSHPILGEERKIFTFNTDGTQRREYVTLPLGFINGWLFSIDVSRVKEEIRDTLITYQRECHSVLSAYFTKSKSSIEHRNLERLILQEKLKEVETELSKLMRTKKDLYKQIAAIDTSIHEQLRIIYPNSLPDKTVSE